MHVQEVSELSLKSIHLPILNLGVEVRNTNISLSTAMANMKGN